MLVPVVPVIAARAGDALVFGGVGTDTHSHAAYVRPLCEHVLISQIGDKKAVACRPLKAFQLVSTNVGWRYPIKRDFLPDDSVVSGGQFVEKGISYFLHDSRTPPSVRCSKKKIESSIAEMWGTVPEKKICSFGSFSAFFAASDSKPSDDYETVSEKHNSDIGNFRFTDNTARKIKYFFAGLVTMASGIGLVWFGECDPPSGRLVNQM